MPRQRNWTAAEPSTRIRRRSSIRSSRTTPSSTRAIFCKPATRCCVGIASKVSRSWRRRSPSVFHARRSTMHRRPSLEKGLAGLVPRLRGPKGRHKLSGEVLQHVLALKSRRPDSHNNTVRAGDSTAIRDTRASSQSRTRPAEQKKTARSATEPVIPAHAAADYEALREQLFGIEHPGVRATGFSVLVRCGLAAWACGGHERAASPPRASASPPTPPDHINAGSALAKLIANLILSPRQEIAPCRT